MSAVKLDHFYKYGDVYEALDACDQLELLLGRLRRAGTVSDAEWMRSRQQIGEVRARIETHLKQP